MCVEGGEVGIRGIENIYVMTSICRQNYRCCWKSFQLCRIFNSSLNDVLFLIYFNVQQVATHTPTHTHRGRIACTE